jgi:hypothetical protein
MSHPPDYADYADTAPPPIDLPDNYDATETDGERVIAWMAVALFIVFAIGGALILWSTLS